MSTDYKICSKCNKEQPVEMFYTKNGRRKECKDCTKVRTRNWRINSTYLRYKSDRCIKCGFIAEHRCQLDLDHIDGNHSNNEVANLQTLCSNCHRLKTWTNKEGSYRRGKL